MPIGLPTTLLNGVKNGCPFCLSVYSPLPRPGQQITLLSGYHCGVSASMVEIKSEDKGTFVYKVFDDSGSTYMSNRGHDDVISMDMFCTPDWAPPLSVEDAHKVHWAFLNEFMRAHYEQRPPFIDNALVGLVGCIWSLRLPILFGDLWPMLSAHGWPPSQMDRDAMKLNFALDAVRSSAGRSSIKRRRLRPFETWRYEPKRKQI